MRWNRREPMMRDSLSKTGRISASSSPMAWGGQYARGFPGFPGSHRVDFQRCRINEAPLRAACRASLALSGLRYAGWDRRPAGDPMALRNRTYRSAGSRTRCVSPPRSTHGVRDPLRDGCAALGAILTLRQPSTAARINSSRCAGPAPKPISIQKGGFWSTKTNRGCLSPGDSLDPREPFGDIPRVVPIDWPCLGPVPMLTRLASEPGSRPSVTC